jgi:two-component system, NarL family, response regulator DegU
MKPKSISILLVDDHRLFRSALTRLLRTFKFPFDLYEASNGKEGMNVLKKEKIDIVLLDIQMPEMGGVEMLKILRREGKQTKVIMLTQFEDQSLIVYLRHLGANGFLFKNCEPTQLKETIQKVFVSGIGYIQETVNVTDPILSNDAGLSNLDISPREFQVLVLIKDGKTNKEVARILGLTIRTIESYRKRLIKKTKSKNTIGLINLAYRTGMC